MNPTAGEMIAAIHDRRVSSVELVTDCLKLVEQWQPAINAVSQVWAGEALEEAAGIDTLSLDDRPPLAGLPMLVKDLFDVRGHETSACCEAFRGNVANRDAALVARLRHAGAVIFGKTNQHEMSAGGTNLVSSCGPTRNPIDQSRMTGGSSGGSAAAVAAGIVPLSVGSDTGGSVRIPASFCGTYGLKPTNRLLPTSGMLPLAPPLDCPGFFATTSEDLALILHQALGEDRRPKKTRVRIGGFRVGLPESFFEQHITADVLRITTNVAVQLQNAGAEIESVDGMGIEDARQVWDAICLPEFARVHEQLLDREGLVSDQVLDWLRRGAAYSDEERARASERQKGIAQWFRERLHTFDALLIPTTPYAAPRIDDPAVELPIGRVMVKDVSPGWITSAVNLAGLPAVNIPAGRTSEGLPVGASFVGQSRDEDTLLALAKLWEVTRG